MENTTFKLSFRCFYEDGEPNTHWRFLTLGEIPRWIDAYKFTHPNCTSITVKVWFNNPDKEESAV